MAAMKKLLNKDMIGKLVEHPDQLDMNELIELSRSFFKLQAAVGSLGFAYGAFHSSMSLTTVGNFMMPLLGIYSTRDDNPDNYKCLRLCALYWILGAIFYFFEAFLGFDLHKVMSGTLKTTVYGLQWLVLARLWRWLQERYVGTVKFYLNVVVKNKKEVVQTQARERSRVAGKILGKIANRLVTDDVFSEKLAGNLEKSMPKRLQDELGVTATATKQFQRGNFLVLLVSIEKIDMRKMIASKSSEMMLKRFDKFMHFLGYLPTWVMMDLQNLVLLQVGNGLIQRMPENMTRQLRDAGGVEVEVESRRPEEEAELFFAAMKQLDDEANPSKGAASPAANSPKKSES